MGPLRGAQLEVGTTDGDAVPVVRVPIDGSRRGPVQSIDLLSGSVTDLGPLPIRRFAATATVVDVGGRVVLSTDLCTKPPTVGEDAGFDCPSGDMTWGVFLHGDGGWSRAVDSGTDPATVLPNVVVDDGVVYLVPVDSEQSTLVLDPAALTTRPGVVPSAGGRCEFSPGDSAVIDTTAGVVRFRPEPSAPEKTVALSHLPAPFSTIAPGALGLLDCDSSGPYLAMADPSRLVPAPRGPPVARGQGVTTTAVASPPGDSSSTQPHQVPATVLIDLRHPDRPAVSLGADGYTCCLMSGDRYWAWEDDGGVVHVRSPNGQTIAEVGRRGTGSPIATRHAIALLDFDSRGRATALRVVRVP